MTASPAPATVTIPAASRYKDTRAYIEGGVVEFALLEPPIEFSPDTPGTQVHRVVQNEIGFLDIIAVRYYGQGQEGLWWVIAMVNGMLYPELEMYPGQPLVIPDKSRVTQFLSRTGDGATAGA